MPEPIDWPEGTPAHLTEPVPSPPGVRVCDCGARVYDGDTHICTPKRKPGGGEGR